jgi:hypothetical protein
LRPALNGKNPLPQTNANPALNFLLITNQSFSPIKPLKAVNKSTPRRIAVVVIVAACQFLSIKQSVAF